MSKTREDLIEEFHKAFKRPVKEELKAESLNLRKTLIKEEVDELVEEIDNVVEMLENGEEVSREKKAELLKEMADVQVVLSGTAVQLKAFNNLEKALKRVHESNMSKLDENGEPILREDGKILKGPDYFKPDLIDLVE